VDGLKTGLTKESGHCIDATAIRNGNRLIAVVMGGPTWHASTAAIESLLNYGEKFFTDAPVATAGAQIDVLNSPILDAGSVPIGPAKTIVLTVPMDAAKQITHRAGQRRDERRAAGHDHLHAGRQDHRHGTGGRPCRRACSQPVHHLGTQIQQNVLDRTHELDRQIKS
jgi:D-alanyl-D-alanine carboxypeptidase